MDKTLERILSLLPHKDDGKVVHGAKKELAQALGFKQGNVVAMWINGTSRSYTDYLPAIAARYGVTVDWLLGDTDERGPVSDGGDEITKKYRALDEHGKKLVDMVLNAEYERCAEAETAEEPEKIVPLIRHYLSRPAAGLNGLVEGEDYEDIPRTPDMPEDADFCLTVSGDSMLPYIRDGEMVFVSGTAPLHPMDVGVFSVDGATYVKQYAPSYDGALYLLSANPAREDANLTIPRDSTQSVQYFGKVLLKEKLPAPVYGRSVNDGAAES